jgi:hypothetical protein
MQLASFCAVAPPGARKYSVPVAASCCDDSIRFCVLRSRKTMQQACGQMNGSREGAGVSWLL